MSTETYVIYNESNTTRYVKEFATASDCRHWIINHLDLSEEWNHDRLEFIIKHYHAIGLHNLVLKGAL